MTNLNVNDETVVEIKVVAPGYVWIENEEYVHFGWDELEDEGIVDNDPNEYDSYYLNETKAFKLMKVEDTRENYYAAFKAILKRIK